MLTLAELVARVAAYRPGVDLGLIGRAYRYAEEAHAGQVRKSGEPYFAHPASVAGVLADLQLDVASVCAALLHDVIEDTEVNFSDLEREFGTEVAFLVDGVTKLSKIDFTSKQDRQAESFRKLVAAMARDIRVLLIKLCDRLDNMRTLQFMSTEGQERIARETMDIYAPLADRLGLALFKSELQELSFRFLQPKAYEQVEAKLGETRPGRDAFIAEVSRQLTARLAQQGFTAVVTGRTKHAFSIWTKMQDRQCEFEHVHDRVAFHVQVETAADCYAALGVIHSMWTPVPGRFKDYLALPKPNLYQALHTTVFGLGNQRIEIQIRTHDMHRTAEHGVVAHWRHSQGISGGIDPKDAARFGWLRQLVDSQTELKDPAEFLESVKVDLFQDEVYVFTPKGDVRAFPRGASPIDFAFGIHTEIGNQTTSSRVNGSVVPLNYKLHNGDLVEVTTDPAGHPYKEWLDWAVTSRARNEIRRYLRTQQRARSLRLGGELLERALHEAGLSLARLLKSNEETERLLARFGARKMEDLYVHVGYGKLRVHHVVEFLLSGRVDGDGEEEKSPPASLREGRIEAFVRKVTGRSSHGILLNGVDDVLVRYTKCCNPLPGDEIVGFMTRGRGITVHRRDCAHAFEADPQRRVEISWDPKAKINRPVKLTVVTANRPGILATVGQTFHVQGINITEATCRASDNGRATNTFTFLCADLAQLKDVVRNLQKIDGVIDVDRG